MINEESTSVDLSAKMWSTDDVIPLEANNNNIDIDINKINSNNNTVNNNHLCTQTFISNLMKNDISDLCYKGNTSPQDQHSNNSSLESLNSPLNDDNQLVSTSCSEDSFEMSSTTSRTANDLPTPSDYSSHPFLSSDSIKRTTSDGGHDNVDNNEQYESIGETDLKTESGALNDATENNHPQSVESKSHQAIMPNRSDQSIEQPSKLKSSEVTKTLVTAQNKPLEGKCGSINASESVAVDAKIEFEHEVNHKNESQIELNVPEVNEVSRRIEKRRPIAASVGDTFAGVSSTESCSSSETASELTESLPNNDKINLSATSSSNKTSSGDRYSSESDSTHSTTRKEHDKDVALASARSIEMPSTNEVPSSSQSSAIPSSTKEVDEQKSSTTNSSELDLFNRLDEYNWRAPSTSKSMGSISNKEALQRSIDAELNSLDTRLPNLDFNKLEQQLHSAARERMIIERKLLGEQVRRRLALQVDQLTAGPSPRILTRPSKSNLGFRLQTAMNLQVCYMNDIEDDEDEGGADSDSSSDDDFGVPKSKSAPNLRGHVHDGSSMNATQLRKQIASNQPNERRLVLENETKLMLAKAKQTAKMQMELEKLYAPRSSKIPKKSNKDTTFKNDLSTTDGDLRSIEQTNRCGECRIDEVIG